ncbi:TDP-N-acetylfucosamine:lipid II N-acetylfucosaminyltransferase [Lacihabitans sp. LS3-19]|uniref:TDP-N-acetylfucosamine:lipid II N-acetylfucosaminyltransferase n=1 Tax=Lacihabitans sp. LS3-19 TaxID=2487335 RepID=UPI00286EADE0|nr:TDP-N-acetylfucosamine:lipid II N-acetylfucosaminyltransferase [Lacihabitans sp. LS3-19]
MNLENFREALLLYKKIDYFISYIHEDFEIFSKYYKNKMQFVYAPFLTLNQYLGNISDPNLNLNTGNILVGNSASLESNYFEVLDKLKDHKGLFTKAFFVLNYGYATTSFKNKFQKEVQNILGLQGESVLEFMDLTNYMNFLKTCNTAVFLHYRQQAMGNIISLIYLGARVYLSKNNPILNFFLEKEIKVSIFESEFEIYGTSELTLNEKEVNRRNLEKIFSVQNSNNIYSNILNLLA